MHAIDTFYRCHICVHALQIDICRRSGHMFNFHTSISIPQLPDQHTYP